MKSLRRRRFAACAICCAYAMICGIGLYAASGAMAVAPLAPTATPSSAPDATQTPAPTPEPPPHATLSILLPGTPSARWDAVMTEFAQRTSNSLNLSPNVAHIPAIKYQQELQTRLASDSSYDMVYDAYDIGLESRLAQGAYHRLDDLLGFPGYEGLARALSPELLAANRYGGANYTIPLGRAVGEIYGVALRGDLREAFGLPVVDSLEGLEAYLQAALDQDGGRAPLLVNANKDGGLRLFERAFREPREAQRVYRAPLSEFLWADVLLSEDLKTVQAVSIADFQRKNLQAFPGDYAYLSPDDEPIARDWVKRKFVGFSSAQEYDKWERFYAGGAASIVIGLSEYESVARAFELRNPGARCEFFVPDDAVRAMTPGALRADGRALAHLAIPANSSQASRALALYDWIVSDAANHDLLAYGIEDVDWEAVGDTGWRRPEGAVESEAYALDGRYLTGNALYHRDRVDLATDTTALSAYAADRAALAPNPLSGFTFDTRPVGDQVFRCGPAVRYALAPLQLGQIPDRYEEVVSKVDQKMRDYGDREALRREVQAQVQAYLSRTN